MHQSTWLENLLDPDPGHLRYFRDIELSRVRELVQMFLEPIGELGVILEGKIKGKWDDNKKFYRLHILWTRESECEYICSVPFFLQLLDQVFRDESEESLREKFNAKLKDAMSSQCQLKEIYDKQNERLLLELGFNLCSVEVGGKQIGTFEQLENYQIFHLKRVVDALLKYHFLKMDLNEKKTLWSQLSGIFWDRIDSICPWINTFYPQYLKRIDQEPIEQKIRELNRGGIISWLLCSHLNSENLTVDHCNALAENNVPVSEFYRSSLNNNIATDPSIRKIKKVNGNNRFDFDEAPQDEPWFQTDNRALWNVSRLTQKQREGGHNIPDELKFQQPQTAADCQQIFQNLAQIAARIRKDEKNPLQCEESDDIQVYIDSKRGILAYYRTLGDGKEHLLFVDYIKPADLAAYIHKTKFRNPSKSIEAYFKFEKCCRRFVGSIKIGKIDNLENMKTTVLDLVKTTSMKMKTKGQVVEHVVNHGDMKNQSFVSLNIKKAKKICSEYIKKVKLTAEDFDTSNVAVKFTQFGKLRIDIRRHPDVPSRPDNKFNEIYLTVTESGELILNSAY